MVEPVWTPFLAPLASPSANTIQRYYPALAYLAFVVTAANGEQRDENAPAKRAREPIEYVCLLSQISPYTVGRSHHYASAA